MNLSQKTTNQLIDDLMCCGHDSYYDSLYKPVIKEITKRLKAYDRLKQTNWEKLMYELDESVCEGQCGSCDCEHCSCCDFLRARNEIAKIRECVLLRIPKGD